VTFLALVWKWRNRGEQSALLSQVNQPKPYVINNYLKHSIALFKPSLLATLCLFKQRTKWNIPQATKEKKIDISNLS
jgi:hypothetical protein